MKISSLIFLVVFNVFAFAQNNSNEAVLPIVLAPIVFQYDSIPSFQQEKEASLLVNFKIKYKLEKPDQTFDLPDILKEISGLSFDDEFKKIYAVQDENGIIFILNKKSGEIEKQIKFHKDGDYEGIEVVGENVYVVKSTGTIYEVKNLGEDDQKMEKYNLFLERENDVEGLCFDSKNNKLLMACKGVPATGESFEVIRYKKVVYGFDLDTKEIDSIPVYNIQLDAIQKCLHTSKTIKDSEDLKDCFSFEKENLDFNPSAIAIHPITKDIYVLSSSGKTLIVLNSEGEIIYIEKLDKKIHRQPEGIAFDADATLYISNEGKEDDPAKIYRFNYNK
jgi:uncharacterized protein YjiK